MIKSGCGWPIVNPSSAPPIGLRSALQDLDLGEDRFQDTTAPHLSEHKAELDFRTLIIIQASPDVQVDVRVAECQKGADGRYDSGGRQVLMACINV